jgi:hypothetical protein
MTEPAMLAFILRRIRASTIFFAPYSKLQRRLLKAALTLFGSADAAPRVQAILLVRSMAMKLPQPSLDACLKGVYRAYSSNAKFVNAASVPHINFMAACVVELYGLDPVASYQHAFGFIRQLALLLRQALTSKSKEAYREVYCWQTLNCLELWAKVLAAHSDSTELRPLVYPAVQLLLGAARLVPTPSYFPLRLRCARALNRLAQATGVFVPVAPLVLEILQWGDLSRAPKPAPGDKPTEVLLQLRAGKSVARSAPYQEEIVEQALELLADHLSQWACHVSFPELAHLPLAQLRRYAKTTPVERFRKSARQLADAIERNIAFVGKARDHVEFSPKDLSEVANFLAKESTKGTAPVVQHAATLRDRARARLAARSALEVEIGGDLPGSAKAGLAEADGASGEWDKAPKGNMLPDKKKQKDKKRSRAEEEETEESDDEEDVPKPIAKQQKKKQQPKKDASVSGGVDGEYGDDELMAYELSSDEDDAAPKQKANRSGGASGGAVGGGGGRGGRGSQRGGRGNRGQGGRGRDSGRGGGGGGRGGDRGGGRGGGRRGGGGRGGNRGRR